MPNRIDLETLRSALAYAPETGVFTWKIRPSPKVPEGAIAGSTHKRGYIHIQLKGRIYKGHRLAWFYVHGEWPSAQIDHINRIKGDNRIANLRAAENAENKQNYLGPQRNNKIGLQGVTKRRGRNSYQAKIEVFGVERHLGTYKTPEEASAAYMLAKAEMHKPCGLSL